MALVFKAWSVNLSFIDTDLNTSTVTVYQGDQVPFVDVETFASATVAAIVPLTDSTLIGYTISRNVYEDAPVAPPETSDVERKGFFSFSLANTRKTSLSVPSIRNALVINGTNVIDRANVQVNTFLQLIGLTGTDDIGTDIIASVKAEKRHRKSLKG